jgi:hypothetical protein
VKLQQVLTTLIKEHSQPEAVIERIAARKLKAQGVKRAKSVTKKLAAELARRLTKGGPESDVLQFRFDDSSDEERHLDIELTPEDVEADLKASTRAVTKIVPALSKRVAATVLAAIERGDSDQLRSRRAEHGLFEANLRARWGKAFDSYELFLTVTQECGGEAARTLATRQPRRRRHLVEAIVRMHARACQVAGEILALLRAGYADGAHARWRTLHEIAVICALLSERGDALAERYLLHEDVDTYKAALQYNRHAPSLGDRPISDRELRSMERRVDSLCKRFGRNFRGPSGWASEQIGIPNPKFDDIEQAAQLDYLRPFYKLASYNIHAAAKGSSYRLGAMNDHSLLLAGPSNAGLEEPGRSAAYSLLLTTLSLLFIRPTLDTLVYGQVLIKLCEETRQNFEKARVKLARDEKRVRQEKRTPKV